MTKLYAILVLLLVVACGGVDYRTEIERPDATADAAGDAVTDAATESSPDATEADAAEVDAGTDAPGCTGAVTIEVLSVGSYVAGPVWKITLRSVTLVAQGTCSASAGTVCAATGAALSLPADAADPQVYVHDEAGLPLTSGPAAQLHPAGCGIQSEVIPGDDSTHPGESFTVSYAVTQE